MKYDLFKTFDILVGKEPNQEHFTAYHDLLTSRSVFFSATRSRHWTSPDKPTILEDVDPGIFSAYLHCVVFGSEPLEDHFAAISESERTDETGFYKFIGENYSSDSDNSDSEGTEQVIVNYNTWEDTKKDKFMTELKNKFFVDVYLLADEMLDPTTANLVIDVLIR